jgi:hypothetical protein
MSFMKQHLYLDRLLRRMEAQNPDTAGAGAGAPSRPAKPLAPSPPSALLGFASRFKN